MRSLSIAATGMLAQQTNVDVISNNIANINTTGYKRNRAEFQDLLYQTTRRVGSASADSGELVPAGVKVGVGVRTAAVYRVNEQGPLVATDNSLDVAINGKGFFQVQMPSGEIAYTRAGSFQLSPTGLLVTQDGYQVQPGITLPSDAIDVSINDSGTISVKIDGQSTLQQVGQLELATFPNENGLDSIGNNLLLESPSSGSPVTGTPGSAGFGQMRQRFLETSNVNIVAEITNLITAQRAYEMNSKVIETSDQMMGTVSQLR